MRKIALLIITLFISACSSSNEEYRAEIESRFEQILKNGTDKISIETYLSKNRYEFQETKKENCHKHSLGKFNIECQYESYIHINIAISKYLNPIESSAMVYLFLNKENTLEKHYVHISHSFL